MTKSVRAALLDRLGSALPVRRREKTFAPLALPRRGRLWPRYLGRALLVLVLVALIGWAWFLFTASLPQLDGVFVVEGLSDPVQLERDTLGIPTITARNRLDLARATGFVHGQDRFFQMDLLRRHPAGELSALLGAATLEEDKRQRVHRFRARARQRLSRATPRERELLRAYTEGVEAGRRSLRHGPWEYQLLRVEPVPWSEEDSLLVVHAMYLMLQSGGIARERCQGLVEDLLPPALARFLSPAGSPWDAPMQGEAFASARLPQPSEVDLRQEPSRWTPPTITPASVSIRPGSNNWAVAGTRTAHGGAILANDMHLGLMLPNIWYRAQFHWHEQGQAQRVIGVTLPGTPAMVVGSNTYLAWGFTNTEGDFTDLVVLNDDEPVVVHEERIEVQGGSPVLLPVEETRYGPIVDRDHKGRRCALRWVAHDEEGINLNLMFLESTRTLDEALALAPTCGSPAQNLVVVDRDGAIAWTVLGKLPRRLGFDGTVPMSWNASRRWDGWLDPAEYPRLVRPLDGLLWTANNRVVDQPGCTRIGLANYDHGARAMQIRDGLRARKVCTESDMLAIQLDDRALFLDRWQRLMLDTLTPSVCADSNSRSALRREVVAWGGRASIDSVGFRLVRRWRELLHQIILGSLTAPCRRADPRVHYRHLTANVEESVWQLVTQKPAHLLPPGYASWETLLLDAVDRLGNEVSRRGEAFDTALEQYTWGAANRARIRHPLSAGLGPLARWLRLDMPEQPLPGNSHAMPRVQAPAEGASQRLAVSPGREEEGYFHMPGGQSGHPRSPHYRDGHAAWVEGKATPFLPGPRQHLLELRPSR